MRCGLKMPFGLSCVLDYEHRGLCDVDHDEVRRRLTARPAICGIVSNSGPNGEPLACGYSVNHEGAHAWSTLPSPLSCEKCGTIKTKRVIAVTAPNLPWHDGRSERKICPECPAEEQLPWAHRFDPVER